MKNFIFPSKVIFFTSLVFVIFIVSCSHNSSAEFTETEVQTLLPTSEKTPEKSQVVKTNPNDIAVVKEYAEDYEPKFTEQAVIPSPPEPNEKVLQAISNLRNNGNQEYEKYIMLIYLRLYRFHVENFRQSYELGRDNPLTKEFFEIIKSNDYQKAEMIPSSLAKNCVEENPELLKYGLIEKEMKRIKKAEEKIQKDLERTTKEQKKTNR